MMKAIYTLQIGKNATRNNEYCGYRCKEELLDALLLTTLVSARNFSKVELYCDKEAVALIKADGRDFSHLKLIPCLDKLDWVHEHNWAYAKIYVYSLQKEPFVHIDIDAILWDGVPKELMGKKYFCQLLEYVDSWVLYNNSFTDIQQHGLVPDGIKKPRYAFNMAVFGCTDMKTAKQFLQKYEQVAREYCIKNAPLMGKLKSIYEQCILFEQLFIVSLLDNEGLVLGRDYDTILETYQKENYPNSRYTHLIVEGKRDERNVQAIKWRLQYLTA